jgi:hypothetical protein
MNGVLRNNRTFYLAYFLKNGTVVGPGSDPHLIDYKNELDFPDYKMWVDVLSADLERVYSTQASFSLQFVDVAQNGTMLGPTKIWGWTWGDCGTGTVGTGTVYGCKSCGTRPSITVLDFPNLANMPNVNASVSLRLWFAYAMIESERIKVTSGVQPLDAIKDLSTYFVTKEYQWSISAAVGIPIVYYGVVNVPISVVVGVNSSACPDVQALFSTVCM